MSTDHVREELLEVRASVGPSLANHYKHQAEQIQQNPDITPEARDRMLSEVKDEHKAKIEEARDKEVSILKREIEKYERILASSVGVTGSDVIAYRDAQDRVERIKDADEAERIMMRALRSGDKSLAHALFARSLQRGYRAAATAYTDANPGLRGFADDLADLNEELHENAMHRNQHYGMLRWGAGA